MAKGIIFGISGTIGKALYQTLTANGHEIHGTYNQHRPMNVSSEKVRQMPVEKVEMLSDYLEEVKPDFVVMALRGDFEKQLVFHEQAAKYFKTNGGRMLFCSTANVFDGITDSPHYEDDPPKANSEYGQFKIECERLLTSILGDRLTIVRVPAIYGLETPRMNELLEDLEKGNAIKVYTNVYSTTNSDVMLAKQIGYLLKLQLGGIFHLATKDVMIHSEFTRKLVAQSGFTDVRFEELQIETDLSQIPGKYDNSLLTIHVYPENLQLTHEQLISFLAYR